MTAVSEADADFSFEMLNEAMKRAPLQSKVSVELGLSLFSRAPELVAFDLIMSILRLQQCAASFATSHAALARPIERVIRIERQAVEPDVAAVACGGSS